MNCIIIDDDAAARLVIKQLCIGTQFNVKEEFSSAIEGIKFLNETEVDLIFLDIHMPSFNGFDFLNTIKNPPKVVLTTSDKNFALKAFEFESVIDYLTKPIQKERFNLLVKKIEKQENGQNGILENAVSSETKDYIFVNVDKRLVKINVPEILIIEAKGDYINIKTTGKNFIVHSTLKKIEEKLPSDIFLKIHRSFIINIHKIIDIEDNTVLIEKHVIPISRSHKPTLIKKLNLL